MTDPDIFSLNEYDLDIEELEQRLELAAAASTDLLAYASCAGDNPQKCNGNAPGSCGVKTAMA